MYIRVYITSPKCRPKQQTKAKRREKNIYILSIEVYTHRMRSPIAENGREGRKEKKIIIKPVGIGRYYKHHNIIV